MGETNQAAADQALAVGRELVDLCRQGKFLEAVERLYSPEIVSVEVMGDETMPAEMRGIDAIRGKGEWWMANHEVHGCEVKGPFPHGDRFAVFFAMDVTSKVGPFAGKRMQFEEVGLYTVAGGKVAREEFFYDVSAMGG